MVYKKPAHGAFFNIIRNNFVFGTFTFEWEANKRGLNKNHRQNIEYGQWKLIEVG